ncbi:hypothetical protein [Moraxella nonliquefaciens]|jgi:hypothetical protein|uniref:hypothetical protein n=1 Tax=Moraxella nonliquefaciens TaxID=478 RepID=UPI003EE23431
MNKLQKTYRYLFKLPISVPLIILFFMLMVIDKQVLVMLLRKEGAIWISVALLIVLACEFIFKKSGKILLHQWTIFKRAIRKCQPKGEMGGVFFYCGIGVFVILYALFDKNGGLSFKYKVHITHHLKHNANGGV